MLLSSRGDSIKVLPKEQIHLVRFTRTITLAYALQLVCDYRACSCIGEIDAAEYGRIRQDYGKSMPVGKD